MTEVIADTEKKSSEMEAIRSEMDTTYSWGLVTVSALSYMLFVGNIKLFGILYAELLQNYGTGAGNTAWVGSLSIAVIMVLGPIANHLCIVYTFRRVMVTGAILGSFGFLLTSFMPRMEWMYLSFGMVVGTGYGLLYSTTLTVINYYVEKRRALATGFIVAGSGVGVFILPYLYRVLITEYGIRGCFMVLSAVNLHTCIAGMLVRQPKELKRKTNQPTEMKEITGDKNERTEHKIVPSNTTQRNTSEAKCSCTSTLGLLDVSAFRDPSVAVFAIGLMFHQIAYASILTMLSSHVIGLGYSNEEADFVMSSSGLGEILSKIFFGWLADKACMKRIHLLMLTLLLSGVSAIVISFIQWYPALIIYGVTVGTFTCAFLSLVSVIVIDMVGMERFPSTVGKMHFLFSFPCMVGPPISGWLKDLTGSWILSFRVAGCLSVLAGILVKLDFFIIKYWCCKGKKPKENDTSDS